MSIARLLGMGVLALVMATGCVKKRSGDPAETCDRFGDAAGRCTVGAIEGTVLREGHAVHAEIRVYLAGTDRGTVTAEDGSFTLEKLPPGDYVVEMEADGWVPASAQASVRAERATVLETLTLARATIATSVGGKILLGGRSDHAGTLVSLDGTGVAVFTAADGSFVFSNVPFGAARITARHAGFTAATIDAEVDEVTFDIGDRTLEPLPLPGSVSGVVRAGGELVAGVAVALAGTEFVSQTAPDGTFLLDAVEPGAYEIVVVAAGFLPVSTKVEVESERHTVVPAIDLEAAHDMGSLRGNARRLGEARRDGIEVRLLNGDRLLAVATTDDAGAYRLPEAPVGIHSLVFRAEGFPDVRIPAVAVGPGDWSGPEVTMRRSVLVDSRFGDGATTPSGRKAIISYFSGRYGTHLWDGDTLTQRFVFPTHSILVAVDREESFATLLVETEGPTSLVRLNLATGEVTSASPAPDRLIGTVGGSTFYFDYDGVLHRLLARDTVANRIDVDADEAWIEGAELGAVWVGYNDWEWSSWGVMPFDPESDWYGPTLWSLFGLGPDRFFGMTPARTLVWIDLQTRVAEAIPSRNVVEAMETDDGIVFLEIQDEASSTFDIRYAGFADGRVSDVARGAVDFGWLGDRAIAVEMEDGAVRWVSAEGSARTDLCAGGEILRGSEFWLCHEDGTGASRIADAEGVRTVTASAESVALVPGEEALVWTAPGEPSLLRFVSVRTLQEVPLLCEATSWYGTDVFHRVLISCGGELHVVDVERGTNTALGPLDPVECAQSAAATGLVCLLDEPCGGESWCARAFDLGTGESAEIGATSIWAGRLLGKGAWSPKGGAAAFVAANGPALQVVFPETGAPELAICDLPMLGSAEAIEEDGTLLMGSGLGFFVCDPAGNESRVGDFGSGRVERLGDTPWAFLSDTEVIHLGHRVWYPANGLTAQWWIPPGEDELFLADADGLRRLDEAGTTTLAPGGRALYGFWQVPLFWDGDAVQIVEADGTLRHVADASSIDSGPLGVEHGWFIAWRSGGTGAAFVVSLKDGAVERVAQEIDRSLFHAEMNEALYFNGKVGDVDGFYRVVAGKAAPEWLLERAEYGYVEEGGRTWFFDDDLSWIEHHGAAVLVHDAPIEADTIEWSWERGFIFSPVGERPGTWWFALP